MSRVILLALAVPLAGGCKTAADGESPGSPSESIAGTETQRHGDRASDGEAGSAAAGKNNLAHSLVAVATVNQDAAQPCEQVCGSLGDCLLVDDAYTTVVAHGLELECLDLCVHAPETAKARSEFLACGGRTECGQLQKCAAQSWAALGDARRTPAVTNNVVALGDPCMNGCEWMYTCMSTHQPPGAANLDPQFELEIDTSCRQMCQNPSAADLETWSRFFACVVDRCSEDIFICWEQHY